MSKIGRLLMGGLATACLALTSVVVQAGPAHATDGSPCGPRWHHPRINSWIQTCPDWAPGSGWIPVHYSDSQSSAVVGYINPAGDDWYTGQGVGGTYTLGNYRNNWWAWTMADNGRWGFVSEVYFQGGYNYERDACLWLYDYAAIPLECPWG